MKLMALVFAATVIAAIPTDSAVSDEHELATYGPRDLIGLWRADCNAWGTPARCTLRWAEGLHGSQLTVDYTIVSVADDRVLFAGQGVYKRVLDSRLRGYWVDSGGALFPLAASWGNLALTTHWGTAGMEQGRTRYRLSAPATLEVVDWSLRESGWQEFMRVEYDRIE